MEIFSQIFLIFVDFKLNDKNIVFMASKQSPVIHLMEAFYHLTYVYRATEDDNSFFYTYYEEQSFKIVHMLPVTPLKMLHLILYTCVV
jgi:hypothetical protein